MEFCRSRFLIKCSIMCPTQTGIILLWFVVKDGVVMDRNERFDVIEVGKRLRFEREKLGLSQEEMAFRLGISDRQYRRYENGTSQMKSNIIFALDGMGVELDYLCNGQVGLDYMVERCFMIMPDDMLYETVEKMTEIEKRHKDDGDTNELVDLLLEMREYAIVHRNDKVLRKVPPFIFFTKGYEMLGEVKIAENTGKKNKN